MAVYTQVKTEDSLKKRYLFKLATNLIGFLITLATAGLAPRALGPAAYGDFNFLSTFFSRVISFFDTGTSTAFYTKLSQRPQETGLVQFYWLFTIILSLVVFLFMSVVFILDLETWLWPGQAVRFIWMGVGWGLLTWYSHIINQMLDAYGLTVGSEVARIQQRVLGLGLIVSLFWLNRLSLTTFFIYHYVILLFLAVSWWRVLKRAGLSLFPKGSLTLTAGKSYSIEFYKYSGPLITYSFVTLLLGIIDSWLLQRFAGSVQQGFFGLSFRIGGIVALFTTAMTPLMMRELSRAYKQQNLSEMRRLFRRYIPLLYAMAAYFAIFLAVQADKVGLIFGGSEFQGATLAISIMALYPINQTYGQLSGSVFLATGQTRLYRNLGISMMILGLPITFWLIAPKVWFGLNLGATGLAIKMVLIQFVTINLHLWYNARFLRLSFWEFLGHQLYTIAILVGIAWPVKIGVDRIFQDTLVAFLVSGFIYTLVFIVISFLFPSLFFMTRTELKRQLTRLISLIKQPIQNVEVPQHKIIDPFDGD